MSDENVNKWIQKGEIYLWRYEENTRNYPGWHLTANKIFRRSFADLIERMMTAKFTCQKSVKMTSPTKEVLGIPNNRNGAAKWKSPETLVLKHQNDSTLGNYFFLEESKNTVIISAGQQKLKLLNECVLRSSTHIDYSIEIGNTQLWFW